MIRQDTKIKIKKIIKKITELQKDLNENDSKQRNDINEQKIK